MIEIPINYKNLNKFLKNIRFEDKLELKYSLQKKYKKKFIKIVKNTKNTYFVADKHNNPIAIGGVLALSHNNQKIGQVWLLVCSNYFKHKVSLYKYVKNKIDIFKNDFDVLFNFIYKSNFDAIFWLQKVGFNFNFFNDDFKLFYFTKGGIKFDLRYTTCK